PEHSYFSALIHKLTGILKEPKIPVIAPAQVLRVLVLPYQGENAELYMPRYIYLIVDEAQWVLANQLSEQGSKLNKTKTGQHTFPLR
ncbi:MAG: TraV family lipoprotein, partial [Nitrospiria bacterium]